MKNNSVKTVDFTYNDLAFSISFYPLTQRPPIGAGRLVEFYELWLSKPNDEQLPKSSDMTFETLRG